MRNYILAASAAVIVATGAYALETTAATHQQAEVAAAARGNEVRSGDYRLDKAHAKIVWATSHFGFSTYYGEFTDFDARLRLDGDDPEASRLTVNVATASVDTHDEALDTHLRGADFFDVGNHPSASFTSTAIRMTGANTAEVTGNFTLRGQTRPLTLAVTFNKAGTNMAGTYTTGFSATGTIRRSDYGVSYGLPAVGDEVRLTISGEFNLV